MCTTLDDVVPDLHSITHRQKSSSMAVVSFMLFEIGSIHFYNSFFIVTLVWEMLHSTSPSYRFRLHVPRKALESPIVKRSICV